MVQNLYMANNTASKILKLIETVHRLRAPGGCPWDREQTHQSLRPYLIEEAHEVLEVLDQIDPDDKVKDPEIQANLKEELGDLLLQVLLHSELAREQGAFDVEDVADNLNQKIIRRHPHVFGDQKAKDAKEALQSWEKQKALEKKKERESVLDGLPKNLPALQRAERIIEKVSSVGFQWKDLKAPLDKVLEEFQELRNEIETSGLNPNKAQKNRIASELGDLLLTVANLSFLYKIHPEDALRATNQKFERRFRFVEKKVKSSGKTLEDSSLEEMDRFWNEAKKEEL